MVARNGTNFLFKKNTHTEKDIIQYYLTHFHTIIP